MGAKTKADKYTLACDFDGVIHQHITPWKAAHIIEDPPIPDSIGWLWKMNQKFKVVIFTTRGRTWRGRRAVKQFLRKYSHPSQWYSGWGDSMSVGLEEIEVTDRKPAALAYLDDRSMRFEGVFPTADQIHRAHPWKIASPTQKTLDSGSVR